VSVLSSDDPAIPPPNKSLNERTYWFFRFLQDANVEVIDNRAPFPFRFLTKIIKIEVFQAFRALVRQDGFDVVISHSFNSAFLFALIRSLFSKKKPLHFVIDIGSLNGGKENRLQIRLIRRALQSVAGLIYHSTINERFYSKHFPEIRRKFVSFGTDPDLWKPRKAEEKPPFALSIGYAFRDYETLIRAWSRLEIPLKIVGTESTNRMGLRNVQLIPKVALPLLQELIGDAMFIVLPITNVRYSMGQMTLTQCMSMQKSIIVSRSYGVADYCEDGINCLTYECGNDSEIVAKVKMLSENPELAKKIASKARCDVLSKFNERDMAQAISGFIAEVSHEESDNHQ
jgi:glycosyltransferase involved in cell wall biosynthesis